MSRRTDTGEGFDTDVPVPEMNEQPYYVARLERRLRSARYATEWLSGLSLSTLKLIDAHGNPSDLDANMLKKYSEAELRNILFIGNLGDNKGTALDTIAGACKVIQMHHKLKSEDLTKLDPRQATMVAEAVHFLVLTKLMQFAPPRLTHFVMSRPGNVEAIHGFIKEHMKSREDAHHIDLDHLAEYLDSASTPLRNGTL